MNRLDCASCTAIMYGHCFFFPLHLPDQQAAIILSEFAPKCVLQFIVLRKWKG